MDGYRTLKAGQPVEFNVKPSDKGLHAIDIRVVTDDAESSQESSPTSDVA